MNKEILPLSTLLEIIQHLPNPNEYIPDSQIFIDYPLVKIREVGKPLSTVFQVYEIKFTCKRFIDSSDDHWHQWVYEGTVLMK